MMPGHDPGGDDTLPREDGDNGASSAVELRRWERYELLGLLGEGAMGEVHRAHDRRLNRTIALKFLRSTDPGQTRRFLGEARTLAGIDHPGICRVYEAGEIAGRAYMALQLVDGEPLHIAAAQMARDEKVQIVRDVAMAMQEVHGRGIVHRDLKPANIMVERRESGAWRAVVVDFGLARDATALAARTASGAVLGTPTYMAPEQARGDARAVDRRSDVYGIGATLYELLTDQPPFPATDLAVLLQRVIRDDPTRPRSLVPSLPLDLDTIVLKCLAKDPAARYQSARALADDLDRYLDGEPILGRRPSLWKRARRRAHRHRALVVLGGWSVAALAVVTALAVRSWLDSRRERALAEDRARLAAQIAVDAKDIEQALRIAYLLPLHDTRPDRAHVHSAMASIARTPHNLGAPGDALVRNALGRGHLALHEWQEAADEFARAAANGLQTPQLHAARGRALGEQYHRALDEARRMDNEAWLARRKAELMQQYLTPALNELAQSGGGGDAELLSALIALYRDDFATAEQHARIAAARAPDSFEARTIAAEAVYRAALASFDRGDYAGARPALERALELYEEAGSIARSDPALYEAVAQVWLQRADVAWRTGQDAGELHTRALDAIDRALQTDPDAPSAYTSKAYILLHSYRMAAMHGLTGLHPLLEGVEQAARRAVELGARSVRAWDALGSAHIFRGIYESATGGDTTPWWTLARDEIGKALAIARDDLWANNDLAVANRWIGTSLDDAGSDPMPAYHEALRGFERAVAIDPRFVNGWTNQADLHAAIAERDVARGADPRPSAARAIDAGQHGLDIDPNYYSLLATMAQAELAAARYLVDHGDPAAALARARVYLDRAVAVQPGNMGPWYYRIVAAELDARFRVRAASDASSAIAAGRAALRETLRLDPGVALVHIEAARLDLVEAASVARSPRAAAIRTHALEASEHAIQLDPKAAEADLVAAEVCLDIVTARPSQAMARRGIEFIHRALALHPGLPGAQAVLDALVQRM